MAWPRVPIYATGVWKRRIVNWSGLHQVPCTRTFSCRKFYIVREFEDREDDFSNRNLQDLIIYAVKVCRLQCGPTDRVHLHPPDPEGMGSNPRGHWLVGMGPQVQRIGWRYILEIWAPKFWEIDFLLSYNVGRRLILKVLICWAEFIADVFRTIQLLQNGLIGTNWIR